MEKGNDNQRYSLIDRLRMGEIIPCIECKNGYYETSASDISISHEFNCNSCGSVIRVSPNVIVEQTSAVLQSTENTNKAHS